MPRESPEFSIVQPCGERGSRGFSPVRVGFDKTNTSVDGRQLAAAMTDHFEPTFPVGYVSKENVDHYPGRAQSEIPAVARAVVIDCAGTLRAATSGRGGDQTLEDEGSPRGFIAILLDESRSPGAAAK